jgi:hypothetical protein
MRKFFAFNSSQLSLGKFLVNARTDFSIYGQLSNNVPYPLDTVYGGVGRDRGKRE